MINDTVELNVLREISRYDFTQFGDLDSEAFTDVTEKSMSGNIVT
jgi:hypothetical protein